MQDYQQIENQQEGNQQHCKMTNTRLALEQILKTVSVLLSSSLFVTFMILFIFQKDLVLFKMILDPKWFIATLPIIMLVESIYFAFSYFKAVSASLIVTLNIMKIIFLTFLLSTTTSTPFQHKVYTLPQNWGPILSPLNDGLNLTWYTKTPTKTKLCINNTLYYGDNNLSNTKLQYSCLIDVDVPLMKYHQIYIQNTTSLSFVFNGELIEYDNTPRDNHTILITTDEHDNALAQNTAIEHGPFDFHISGGDRTFLTLEVEQRIMHSKFHRKPYAQAVGNHDSQMALDLHVGTRNFWYYQNIQGLHLFFLYAFDLGKHIYQTLNDTVIDMNFEWLEKEISLHQGLKFIVSHRSIYSTGLYGSSKYFTQKMEEFLEKHKDQKIAAIISGHDHVYASFKNKLNQYVFVAGIGGGETDNVNSITTYKDRAWNATELHGPLEKVETMKELCYGYEYHLDSYAFLKTFTIIEINQKQITYTVKKFKDLSIVVQYVQNIEEIGKE